ncbi:MAG: hypothetical protein OXG15_15525 [Gammaproteobacteria bacterium]|nr:hypothetical protein [Gammaproteobacteria bacterium]
MLSSLFKEEGTRPEGQRFTVLRLNENANTVDVRLGYLPVISRCRPVGSGHDFRRRTCFSPVSAPLQYGIRFLQPHLPATASDPLAVFLPNDTKSMGAMSGLPSSV